MRVASTSQQTTSETYRGSQRTSAAMPERARRVSRLTTPPMAFVTHGATTRDAAIAPTTPGISALPAMPPLPRAHTGGIGSATALPAFPAPTPPQSAPQTATTADPDVWLIALPSAAGGMRSLEGAERPGAIRVGRPYGHLRSIRPVALNDLFATGASAPSGVLSATPTPRPRRGRSSKQLGASGPLDTGSLGSGSLGMGSLSSGSLNSGSLNSGSLNSGSLGSASTLPAAQPMPAVLAAVEMETDAGTFRVERRDSALSHSDLAWALAHMEAGEPESVVPMPRRQLALLLTLLPMAENPEHPELDPNWGWAHKLRAPWERGPLHPRGRLGRLIAIDPDESGRGQHRACFELLGSEEVVWALGVPCFRTGSVYELVPLGKGLTPSRWLTWPLSKGRRRAGAPERPTWEIARVVYRVGAPRWPLAGVVEPLGPIGVAG